MSGREGQFWEVGASEGEQNRRMTAPRGLAIRPADPQF